LLHPVTPSTVDACCRYVHSRPVGPHTGCRLGATPRRSPLPSGQPSGRLTRLRRPKVMRMRSHPMRCCTRTQPATHVFGESFPAQHHNHLQVLTVCVLRVGGLCAAASALGAHRDSACVSEHSGQSRTLRKWLQPTEYQSRLATKTRAVHFARRCSNACHQLSNGPYCLASPCIVQPCKPVGSA